MVRIAPFLSLAVLAAAQPVAASAQDSRQIDALEQEIAALRARLDTVEAGHDIAQQFLDEVLDAAAAPLSFEEPSSTDDLYESQGWTSRFGSRNGAGAWLGGYMDSELRFDNVSDNGSDLRFDQHRLIPFISAHITDRIRFATEIELEHGGNLDNDGEIKIEFAHMDWLLQDGFNFRAGIILSPLGRLNVLHDSPLLDLTDRPLVNRFVIPTTLMESGAGFFGGWDLGDEGLVSYEIYAVNGFEGLEGGTTASFSDSNGLKNGKGSLKSNPDGQASFVGRIAYSPMLGLELGMSAHHGVYDDLGNNSLTIKAFDAFWSNGPLEMKGEFAHAGIGRDAAALAALVPGDMSGFYVEADYHFFPESWRGWDLFGQESTFTGVLRAGSVDLDGGEKDRITVGVNLRPVEDTVFKLEFQMNEEGGTLAAKDFDTVVLSMATYF